MAQMTNLGDVLEEALTIEGALAVALVDAATGMTLGSARAGRGCDEGGLDVEVAAAGSTDVVRAVTRTLDGLRLEDGIEDMLVTTTSQLHLTRLVAGHPGLFLSLVMDRERATLGMARFRLAALEKDLVL